MGPVPAPWWLYVLLIVSVACGFVLLAIPRALTPTEPPALALSAAAVAAQQAEDAKLALDAPHGAAAEQLISLYQAFGQIERVGTEPRELTDLRRRSLHLAYERVREESGGRAVLALRALALSKLEAALDDELRGEEIGAWLGAFPSVLFKHYATRDGLELAPHFVVRTLYKARWNRALELPLDSDFARIERQAYYGWLGLHAYNLPLGERRQALLGFAAAGGEQASEAQGVLAFLDHDYTRAVDCLARAYAENRSWRVRNYLRGAQVAAASAGATGANSSHEASGTAHAASRYSPRYGRRELDSVTVIP
ncbi:MAG: hypothetical protein ABW321_07405 [Polyangiales bacterium]